MTRITPQNYPRIEDKDSNFSGCLDETTLVPHTHKIPVEELKKLIFTAISNANKKSGRQILTLPADITKEESVKIFKREGQELFAYFKKYVSDPAATAHQLFKKHYRDVGREHFRIRTLQKERMNSGWRYQFLALDCAQRSRRFISVSDIGAAEGDFNAVIAFRKKGFQPLSIYVSVKNRSNTMGGQDWPKAIHALEAYAIGDKNRIGPYCCVFGIAMDRGERYIKVERKSGRPYSVNTEIWLSDFFWPFFANYGYEEIMQVVLRVLIDVSSPELLASQIEIPDELLESFGDSCKAANLIDDDGNFHDPYRLVEFFCEK
ncbi:MAG: hypothetical protein FJZ87_07190 [Chloroflexi bacterium]|nr:hypothetical protein [Chloroflexota bacterium]